jgi:FkbM family methyltransferase
MQTMAQTPPTQPPVVRSIASGGNAASLSQRRGRWSRFEGLWRQNNVESIKRHCPPGLARKAARWLVRFDTWLLWLKAVTLLSEAGGVTAPFTAAPKRPSYGGTLHVNYFDLGLHEEGRELKYFARKIAPGFPATYAYFGFEAAPDLMNAFEAKSAGFCRKYHPVLCNAAVCKSDAETAQLFLRPNSVGNSLRQKDARDRSVTVRAVRLSRFIAENVDDFDTSINILRMNIEGSELDVLEDLIETGKISGFRIFLGMWNDVGKTIEGEKKFAQFLRAHKIRNLTFNGRDFSRPGRLRCIAFYILHAMAVAARSLPSPHQMARSNPLNDISEEDLRRRSLH